MMLRKKRLDERNRNLKPYDETYEPMVRLHTETGPTNEEVIMTNGQNKVLEWNLRLCQHRTKDYTKKL